MHKPGLFKIIVGYKIIPLLCCIYSCLGITGFYAELFQALGIPTWLAVAVYIMPLSLVMFLDPNDVPLKYVIVGHTVAVTLFMVMSLSMEILTYYGYRPEGALLFKIFAHLGWTFFWVSILKDIRKYIRVNQTVTSGLEN